MKLIKLLIVTVFTIQVSNIFAGTPEMKSSSNSCFTSSLVLKLAPTTPAEANFEDETTLTDFAGLAPVTPLEADFNDNIEDQAVDFSTLAPVTPAEADFE